MSGGYWGVQFRLWCCILIVVIFDELLNLETQLPLVYQFSWVRVTVEKKKLVTCLRDVSTD